MIGNKTKMKSNKITIHCAKQVLETNCIYVHLIEDWRHEFHYERLLWLFLSRIQCQALFTIEIIIHATRDNCQFLRDRRRHNRTPTNSSLRSFANLNDLPGTVSINNNNNWNTKFTNLRSKLSWKLPAACRLLPFQKGAAVKVLSNNSILTIYYRYENR